MPTHLAVRQPRQQAGERQSGSCAPYRTVRGFAAALQKPVRLSFEGWAGKPQRGNLIKLRRAKSDVIFEPQRGDLTKPRLKAWVNGTPINPEP